jgi:hypothetical protein
VLRRLPTGDAPCMSLASVARKFDIVCCELSVPPIAETSLLKRVSKLLSVGSDVAAAELVDEESLLLDAASF